MAGNDRSIARMLEGRRRSRDRYLNAIESLESRLMMDADLLATWISWGPSDDTIVEGDVHSAQGTLKVLNAGGSTDVPANKSVDIKVFARPADAVDNSRDIPINKSTVKLNVSGMKPNSNKLVNVSLDFSSVPEGAYKMVGEVDTTNVVTESDETNNYTSFAFDFTVHPVIRDLALTVDPKNADPKPPVISDGVSKHPIKVVITNNGNRATDKAQTATFTIVAHPTGGGGDITLPPLAPITIGAISPTKTKKLTLTDVLPLGMDTGNYTFKVTMVTGIASDQTGDNTATTNAFDVTRGFVDVQTGIASNNLLPALVEGTKETGTVKVDLTNIGTVALPSKQHFDVAAFLRPDDAIDNSHDIQIGIAPGQNLGKLGAGKTKSASINVTLSETLNSAAYTLVIAAAPVEALTEDSTVNNSDIGSGITIAPAFTDLHFATVGAPFLANSAGGDTGTATVTILNSGNVAATGNMTITYYATTGSTIDGNASAIGATTVSNLNLGVGKTSSSIKVGLTLPNPANTTSLNILAKITLAGGVADNNTANDATGILATTSTTHATSLWGDVVHPTVIKFGSNTSGSIGFQMGNMYDTSDNLIGTYTMTVPGAVPHVPSGTNVLGLTFTGFSPLGFNPVFSGSEFYFSGKKIAFTTSPSEKKGTLLPGDHPIYFN